MADGELGRHHGHQSRRHRGRRVSTAIAGNSTRPENKIAFLKSDPAVSQLDAVKKGRIVIMEASAMNPTIRTIYGAEAGG